MSLLFTEAKKLANDQLERGVIEEIIKEEPLFALLPFTKMTGKAYVYNREKTLPGASFYAPYDDFEESATDFDTVTVTPTILGGQVDLDNFIVATTSDLNDQLAIQLKEKAKAIRFQYLNTLVNGDIATNAKAFDGLGKLTVAGQTISAGTNGAAIAFSMLDELKDAVKLGADAFMMRRGTWRAIKQALRAVNGNDAVMLQLDNFGKPVPSFDGIPVILNDFMSATETQGSNNNTCSIYAFRANEVDGLFGLYAGDNAGIAFEEIGTHFTKDLKRYRLKMYTGLGLKATHALARIKGITNV